MHRVLLVAAAAVLALTVSHQDLTAQNNVCSGAVCLGSGDNRPVYLIQDGIPRVTLTTTGLLQLLVGQTATARVNTTLTTSTASTCTIADTNETDLWTYTLPANSLTADGRGLRITTFATAAATANNKTIKLYVAGTNVLSSAVLTAAPNALDYVATFTVLRTGASTQIGFGQHGVGTTFQAKSNLVMAGDTTAAIIIKTTGQNGTAAANDICAKGALVETLY